MDMRRRNIIIIISMQNSEMNIDIFIFEYYIYVVYCRVFVINNILTSIIKEEEGENY
jgi:hypothetical protein